MEARFAFGENWARYIKKITPEKIRVAEESLQSKLGSIKDKSFLDIGSGSGLFSLAARNLGAQVVSFDYDQESVSCTQNLKDRFYPSDVNWRIFQGSVLDTYLLEELGLFDIVYSWGVLHHTGQMWKAMDNATARVKEGGLFYISIYNDQGTYSARWKRLKKLYLTIYPKLQPAFAASVLFFRELKPFIGHLMRLNSPVAYFDSKKQDRGMSFWTDWLDWIGGYPFEVAKPEEVFEFCKKRGFTLIFFTTNRGEASCNEFVLKK